MFLLVFAMVITLFVGCMATSNASQELPADQEASSENVAPHAEIEQVIPPLPIPIERLGAIVPLDTFRPELIVFYANGGTPARQTTQTNSQTVTYGQLFTRVQTPVKIDDVRSTPTEEFMMRFIGWFSTPDGPGWQIQPTHRITSNTPRTLYARWETAVPDFPRPLVPVTFETRGSGKLIGATTVEVALGDTLSLAQIPIPVGITNSPHESASYYHFSFWEVRPGSMSSRLTFILWNLTDLVITEATTITADFNMFSHGKFYDVIFLWNDGRTGLDNVIDFRHTVPHNQPITEPEPPVREGFTFVGWTTDAAGNDPFDFTTPTQSATILYAQWVPRSSSGLIEVDRTGTVEPHQPARVGYTLSHCFGAIVRNISNVPTGDLSVTLVGANASSFELTHLSMPNALYTYFCILHTGVGTAQSLTIPSIPPGERTDISAQRSFIMRPVMGLPAGTHTATVEVTGPGGIFETFDVVFRVE